MPECRPPATGSHRRPAEVARCLDRIEPPYVVKHDELAAGKGVVVTDDRERRRTHTPSGTGS